MRLEKCNKYTFQRPTKKMKNVDLRFVVFDITRWNSLENVSRF